MELTQAQYDELTEKISMLTFKQQETNDILEGGLRSANIKEIPAVYVINNQDSLDATYPMLVHFNIISEMTRIVSIKLSFWLLNFRAYSTAATEKEAVTSGPSSAESSESGGGETPTSSDGGSATPTTSSRTTPSGGGDTTGYKGSASGGGDTTGYKGTPSGGGHTSSVASTEAVPVVSGYGLTAHNGGYLVTGSSYGVDINGHKHTIYDHTHPNHYHTTPNHTHPNHYHTTPNHTHPSHTHTVTITDHTHTVTIAAHTHNIPHTHTVPAHSHNITYGIFEEETSPTIQVFISRDNGLTYSLPLGSFTKDQQLDITRFIDTAGDKMIKFTSTTRARLSAQVTIKLDIKAR